MKLDTAWWHSERARVRRFARRRMRTECNDCGLTLTNEAGERLHSANFDSYLFENKKMMTETTIYAWCDSCYEKRINGDE